MLPHDQEALLRDILIYSRKILSFSHEVSRDQFLANEEKQFAIIRCLEIIGEAAGRLSPEAQGVLSTHQLRNIRGMRNRLAHDYRSVSLRIVWETITQDIPPLVQTLEWRQDNESNA